MMFHENEGNIFPQLSEKKAKRLQLFIPYLLALLMVLLMAELRWYVIDSSAYFIADAPARRDYYAVKDDIFLDSETTKNIRNGASDRIIGVLVKGDMQTAVGFDEECNLLLNDPLNDKLLPAELRTMLDSLTLDKREQVITVVRHVFDGLSREALATLDPPARSRMIWNIIEQWKSEPAINNVIYQIVSVLLSKGPQFDETLTERLKASAAGEIAPSRRVVEKGARIVEKGATITPEIAQTLKRHGYPEGVRPLGPLLFALLTALFSVYWISKTIRHSFLSGNYLVGWLYPSFLLISGWLFQMSALCFDIMGIGIFPVIAIACLTLPNVDALSSTIVIVISAAVITSGTDLISFAINLLAGCAGAVAGISLFRKNYSRSAVLLHVMLLGFIMFIVSLLLQWGLIGEFSLIKILITAGLCLALSFSVLLLLPILEMVFDMVSPLQLVELTQPSHPLLKRLQIEAPGTYYHSQMVGNLAEAAAEKIGLNPMLLRAGACFHDIGKLERPQYFIENQLSGINGHDELSPALSALLIISHVKDGLEIAKNYHLPSQIKAFIAEHHGTTCLSYFYKKAQQAGLKVSESQFCYPGPRPQSKETGLLMLADSTEAAARAGSVTLRNVNDIINLVDSVVSSKITAGQLDDVPFTLKELAQIKDALSARLRSMYHTRDIKPLTTAVAPQGKELHENNEKFAAVEIPNPAKAEKDA